MHTFLFFRVPNFGPKWNPIDPNNHTLNYLHMIAPGNLKEEYNSNLGEKSFWKTINFDENIPSNTTVAHSQVT